VQGCFNNAFQTGDDMIISLSGCTCSAAFTLLACLIYLLLANVAPRLRKASSLLLLRLLLLQAILLRDACLSEVYAYEVLERSARA
jgi:hypothetical protein